MCFPRFRFSISRRGVRLGLSLLGGVCLSIPLFRCSPASAVDPVDLQLTYEQTLALYGTELNFTYYDSTTDLTTAKTARFVGYTSSFVPDGHWNDIYFRDSTSWNSCNGGLVYICDFGDSFTTSNSSLHTNIYTKFSVEFTGLSRFRQDFFWSALSGNSPSATPDYSYSLSNASFNSLFRSNAEGFQPGNWNILRVNSWVSYKWDTSEPINENYLIPLARINTDVSNNDETFSISSIEYLCNSAKAYDCAGRTIGDTSYIGENLVLFLIVGRPILTGENPEIVTTAVSTDTPTTTTTALQVDVNVSVTANVDLSGVESDLDTIIQNQQTEISNQNVQSQYLDGIYTTQTAQLNDIISQLDAIYNKMVADGDVSVNFTTAIDNQTNTLVAALGGLVTDIRGLFVPSSADIINFKADLEVLTGQTFLGIDDAETLRNQAYAQLLGVQPVSTIDFPLMNLSDNTSVDFKLKPSDIKGLTVENGNIKVPVKPQNDKFDFFYELAAWGIDIIATLLVVNMLLNKWKAIIVGEKVVEIE